MRIIAVLLVSSIAVFSSVARAEIITGAGPGGGPVVKVFSATTEELSSFSAYADSFQGGVRVAAGDVNSDGLADIIAGAGPGAGPHVKVFDGTTGAEVRSFFAYDPQFQGGVFVAAGDIDGDSFSDIVTGAGAGAGPHVKVFSGQTGSELRSFFAYTPSFSGGVRVAAGDVNNDGLADIITGAGPGAGPHVKVFDGTSGTELRSFFAYDGGFLGGVNVASGDVDGDGFSDIVTGVASSGPPHVKVFSGQTGDELLSILAYSFSVDVGVTVAASDLDGDGHAEIITGVGQGTLPLVKVFDGLSGVEKQSFLAYDRTFDGGVYVAALPRIPEPLSAILFISGSAGWLLFRRKPTAM